MQPENPCDRLARLLAVREALITGQAVTETRFGEDMVKFTPANLTELDRAIAAAGTACAIARGETAPAPRRRYAMGARFRPY